jgi:ribokinase/sulfofructose kinase
VTGASAGTPAPSPALDILAVGGASVDTVSRLDHLPSHDQKVMGELVGVLPGGPAGNFACAASRFGPRVGILAAVGSDEAGTLIVSEFQRYGVDTSRIRVIEGAKSNFTVSLVDPSGEKAIVVVPMLADAYALDDSGQEPPRARLLFGMPDPHGHFFAVARPARKCGAQVMIDIELTTLSELPDPVALLPEADIVSFNRDSFIAVTGDLPAIAAARALLVHGPHTIIVTRGAGGALAVTRDEAAECPGYPVTVVDSTGASDTFNAAFASAMLAGQPLAERLRFANAAAAIAVTANGPRGHLPDTEEVAAFRREHES